MRKVILNLGTCILAICFYSCEKREQPIACFSISSTSFSTTDSIIFEDCSENADGHEWDFGDGSEIQETSFRSTNTLKHKYENPGSYTVKLNVFEHAMWYKSNLKTDEYEKKIEVY